MSNTRSHIIAASLVTALLGRNYSLQAASKYSCFSKTVLCNEFASSALVDKAILKSRFNETSRESYLALDFVTVPHTGKGMEGLNYHYASSLKKSCLSHQFLSTALVSYEKDPIPLEWKFKVSKTLETESYPYETATQSVKAKVESYLEEGLTIKGILLDGECGRDEIIEFSQKHSVPVLIRAKGNMVVEFEGEMLSLKKLSESYLPQRCHYYKDVNWRAKRLRISRKGLSFDLVIIWRKVHGFWTVFFLFSTLPPEETLHNLLRAWKARWGIEVIHRYAKQNLGAGRCQCASIVAQENWLYCVLEGFHQILQVRQHHPDLSWKAAQQQAKQAAKNALKTVIFTYTSLLQAV